MIFILWLPFTVCGQSLNLYDAVEKTMNNYPLLQQRHAEIAAGKAHISTIQGNHLPSLILQDQLNMGTNNAIQGAYFSLGIVPSTSGGNSAIPQRNSFNGGNVAISFLQWEFYNFGYYNAQKKQAEAQLAVNTANLNHDQYQLTQEVVTMYLDWLKKYRLLRIEEENMQRAQVLLTAIRATVLSGLKPGVDSSTASAVYAGAQISYLQALDNCNYDKISLSTYTGMNSNSMVPDTDFVSSFLLKAAAQIPETDSVPASHPLLELYNRQYEQQLADNKVITKRYLPRLGLNGAAWVRNSGISPAGVYPDNLEAGFPYSKYNYLLGMTLTYNLFDLKHNYDQVKEGRYLAQARKSMVQNRELELHRMIQQANSAYETTVAKLKAIPVQLQSANQAYEQQMALYRSGLNTLTDLTNAQYVLLQAEAGYVITQDELLQLLYIRAGLSGQSDIFLQNFKQ